MTDRTKRPLGFGRSAAVQRQGGNMVGSGLRTLTGKGGSSGGAKRLTAPGAAGRTAKRTLRGLVGGMFR